MVAKGVIVVAALMAMARRSLALTCEPCDEYINGTFISPPSWCGPTPTCSYGLTKDVCGCCDVCAKGPGEHCGGLWGFGGRCANWLQCRVPICTADFNCYHEYGTCVAKAQQGEHCRGFGDRCDNGLECQVPNCTTFNILHDFGCYNEIGTCVAKAQQDLCVSPYFLVGEECFRISSNEKDWDSAYLECQLEGSSLAAPEDLDLLRQHLIDSGDTADYWIGGNDKDGTWKWITGDPVQEEWQKGQPSGSSGEDCLDFRVGQWPSLSDYFCLETQKYLCERPLTRTVLPNLEPVQCSSGDGIKVGQKCLAISEDPLNWHEAVTNCTNNGGQLVSLHDKTDPQMFYDFFSHYGATEFWLGGSDIANEGQWVWMNGQPIQEGFPWHPEEPNNAGRNEDCMLWRGHSSDFSDALCKKRYGYICELDVSPSAAQTSGTEPETTLQDSATETPLDDSSSTDTQISENGTTVQESAN